MLVLNEEDNNNLSKLYKGEKVMEDYVKDAKRASISDDIVGLYDKELHEELLKNTELYNAEQKGIKQGKKDGIKEGKEKGIKQGIKQGIKEKAIETAKNMLKDNLSIDMISKYTGLDIKEIEKLK